MLGNVEFKRIADAFKNNDVSDEIKQLCESFNENDGKIEEFYNWLKNNNYEDKVIEDIAKYVDGFKRFIKIEGYVNKKLSDSDEDSNKPKGESDEDSREYKMLAATLLSPEFIIENEEGIRQYLGNFSKDENKIKEFSNWLKNNYTENDISTIISNCENLNSQFAEQINNELSDEILPIELKSYLSGEKTEFDENWKKIFDEHMVINAIVDSLSKVGIDDEENRNTIVRRARSLLIKMSDEEDGKDLYATLEERITSEIKELYRYYESEEDKSKVSNKLALIDALSSISSSNKESEEESHDIELPYLTYDEFKDISSKKESGFLKQYLLELHLAEVAYGDNWKEKIKIPDFTKNIEKWNRGVDDDKKITILDEEKVELESKCLEKIKKFLDGENVDLSNLSFDTGLKLLSDSFDINDYSKKLIHGYISLLREYYNGSKEEIKINDEDYKSKKDTVLTRIDEIYQEKINLIEDYIKKCNDSKENCINDKDKNRYERYEKIGKMLQDKLNNLEREKNEIKNKISNNDFDEKKEKSNNEKPKVDEEARKDVLKKKVFAGIAGFTGGVLTAVFAPAPVVAVAGTILLVNRIVKLAGVVGLGLNKYAETHQDGKIAKLVASYNSFIDKPIISKVVKAYNNPYVQWALSGFTAGIFVGSFYKNVFAPQSNATDAKEVASSTRKPSGGNGGTGSSDTVVDQALDNPSPRDASSAAVSAPSKGPDLDLTHFDASNMHSAYYTSYDTNPVSIQSDLFADTKVINTNVVNGQLKVALGAQDGTPLGWFNAEDIGVTQDMINEAVNNGGIKLL